MLTTSLFLTVAQGAGILTLACAALAVLGFILQWGIRFRLVGISGFMVVVTGGLFALSLAPLTRTLIPGAVRYSLIYDMGAAQTVIAVPPKITESQLEATLRQAAADLFSYGRLGQSQNQLTIRARTIIHPKPGSSQPLLLGQVNRSLASRNDGKMEIEIYHNNFAKLPKPIA
ncbi:MAG: Ycf51 family protein [Chamaesiphon sp.]